MRSARIRQPGFSPMIDFNKPASSWALPGAIVLAGLIATGGWLYHVRNALPDKAGQVVVATPAAEVAGTPKQTVQVKAGVDVYKNTPGLKKKLTLPSAVIEDEKQSVLASSKVPAGEHAHTVTTVINTDTGKSETYVRTDPLPWVAYENRGEVGLYYGLKGGQQAVRLQARQDFVQVKALHLGVVGSVDMVSGKPDYFLGVGAAYRW
jgi:hypothetical protein